MPRIGTPLSYTSGSNDGAPSTCTDAGPPLKMMPAGLRASRSVRGMSRGTISLYTWASRTRRAISCAYWAPKSTTRIVSSMTQGTRHGRRTAVTGAGTVLERSLNCPASRRG